jgi:hypothetical protein
MFSAPQVTQVGNNVHVSYGNDQGLFPVFTIEAVKDEEASIEQGRDIYKDVEWVTINIVGNNLTKVSRPVTEEDKRRFSNYYNAFANQSVQLNVGTPLTEWSLIGKAQAMTLKSMNIHTVEQLAAVADGNLSWMGARASANENAGISKVQAENEQLRRDMEALKNQMAALGKPKKLTLPQQEE